MKDRRCLLSFCDDSSAADFIAGFYGDVYIPEPLGVQRIYGKTAADIFAGFGSDLT